jgi:hypothetical protein
MLTETLLKIQESFRYLVTLVTIKKINENAINVEHGGTRRPMHCGVVFAGL